MNGPCRICNLSLLPVHAGYRLLFPSPGRKAETHLLYILCAVPAVALVWLLNPEWPFWAGYMAGALVCTAILVIQHIVPLPIRCPHCGHAGLHQAPQTPEEQRRPDTGVMLECRGCGSTFYTDARLSWPGKSIRRHTVLPDEWEEKPACQQTGPASRGKESRPGRFS